MILPYLAQDERGNSGQQIPITQGETKVINIFLQNKDGTPFLFKGTITELEVKIYGGVSGPNVDKKYTMSQVSLMTQSGALSGVMGFQFTLAAADTNQMPINSSGVPMTATFTDNTGNILHLDFAGVFDVSASVV